MTFSEWNACKRKKRYVTRGDANVAVKSFRRIIRKFVRAYRCDHCDGWHITTKFLKRPKKRVE